VFLALKGPKKARNIVGNLKINRQQIIRSIKSLQNKGIIASDSENQNVFSALPFEEALELLISKEKEKTQAVQKSKDELLASWETKE
jgi:sugar-specific transcriptional regulator TrmB